MSENWTSEELKAALEAYIDMRSKELERIPFTKKDYYVSLSKKYGRTEKSYEYRMQNISYVYSTLGRRWVTGLRPARNVGSRVAREIEDLINQLEGNSFSNVAEFNTKVSQLMANKAAKTPEGNKNPIKLNSQSTQYKRDPEVVAWVLSKANGICESCTNPSPFEKDDGTPFLEVHHLRMLADSGSDTITNAVALCPNCHRELHYGKERLLKLKKIYTEIERLIEE